MARRVYYSHKNESGVWSFSDNKVHKHDQAHRYPSDPLQGFEAIGTAGESIILRGPAGQIVAAYGKEAHAKAAPARLAGR